MQERGPNDRQSPGNEVGRAGGDLLGYPTLTEDATDIKHLYTMLLRYHTFMLIRDAYIF